MHWPHGHTKIEASLRDYYTLSLQVVLPWCHHGNCSNEYFNNHYYFSWPVNNCAPTIHWLILLLFISLVLGRICGLSFSRVDIDSSRINWKCLSYRLVGGGWLEGWFDRRSGFELARGQNVKPGGRGGVCSRIDLIFPSRPYSIRRRLYFKSILAHGRSCIVHLGIRISVIFLLTWNVNIYKK
jgi:hypothetical protein